MTREPWYWLNDNARSFLARGYLREGQTAEERVRAIGDAAEKIVAAVKRKAA